jgi:hypothetical protein
MRNSLRPRRIPGEERCCTQREVQGEQGETKRVLKELRRQENLAEIDKDPAKAVYLLLPDDLDEKFAYLYFVQKYEEFGDRTLEEAVETGLWTFYFGITKRLLSQEDLRFLTTRGSNNPLTPGTRNRPTLLTVDGETIGMSYARKVLGARSLQLSASCLRANESQLEDILQTQIHDKALGSTRLHRRVAMGRNSEEADWLEESFVCKLFVTYLPVTALDLPYAAQWTSTVSSSRSTTKHMAHSRG